MHNNVYSAREARDLARASRVNGLSELNPFSVSSYVIRLLEWYRESLFQRHIGIPPSQVAGSFIPFLFARSWQARSNLCRRKVSRLPGQSTCRFRRVSFHFQPNFCFDCKKLVLIGV